MRRPTRCISLRTASCARPLEQTAMITQPCSRSILGDTEVAGTPSIAAPGALYAVGFFTPKPKIPEPELLPPLRGVRLRCGGRQLTKTEEQETIIINRPGRSTYPEQKSVLTSGATPILHLVFDGNMSMRPRSSLNCRHYVSAFRFRGQNIGRQFIPHAGAPRESRSAPALVACLGGGRFPTAATAPASGAKCHGLPRWTGIRRSGSLWRL